MKLLILKWDCFCYQSVKTAFKCAGVDLCELYFPIDGESTRNSEKLAGQIANAILKNNADAVFSFNYFPVAAIAAAACKVKYISWTYDSPYISLYSKTINYPTNYVFVFDMDECLNLKRKAVENVYYLPLAADTDYYDHISIDLKEKEFYKADVAFIGHMYSEEKNNLYRHFEGLDKHTLGYIDGIIASQRHIYGASVVESCLTPDIIKKIQKVCPVFENGDGIEDVSWVLSNYFISRYLTSIERSDIIKTLSEKYRVALYTPCDTPGIPLADNRGAVEYVDEFPKAVKCAKVNLNITLRSIVNSIPLRVFDIMGCGGFLLTNYQAELEDYFVPDKDFVYFEDVDDLMEKTGYYLKHDDERIAIARSGYEKVRKFHNFNLRVTEMLKIVNDGRI